jgi:hypothetical protein
MAGLTRLTFATAVVEGNHNAVAVADSRSHRSDLFNYATVFVPQNDGGGKRDPEPRPAALPHVVIAAANAVRLDANDGFVRSAIRVWPVAMDDERFGDLFNNSGFHRYPFPRGSNGAGKFREKHIQLAATSVASATYHEHLDERLPSSPRMAALDRAQLSIG